MKEYHTGKNKSFYGLLAYRGQPQQHEWDTEQPWQQRELLEQYSKHCYQRIQPELQ
jgi:hypothetical protein